MKTVLEKMLKKRGIKRTGIFTCYKLIKFLEKLEIFCTLSTMEDADKYTFSRHVHIL